MRPIMLLSALALLAFALPNEARAYGADELLKSCTEADNDARWGEVAELECEQYINGFIDALRETANTTICVPEQNTADEVRWAYMRWVHEDYAGRRELLAGAALMATLKDHFSCN